MEYIKSLSVVQKLAMIAGAAVLAGYELFACVSNSCSHHNDRDHIVFFIALGVCVAGYFLFPKQAEAEDK